MTVPIATTAAVGPAGGAVAATAATAPPVDPQIAEAARGFEGIFMSMLIDEMMAGTSIGTANPMYAGLVTEKLGDALAEAGGIGLAAVLERQLGGAS
jgi:Rod binding domain-containing protein